MEVLNITEIYCFHKFSLKVVMGVPASNQGRIQSNIPISSPISEETEKRPQNLLSTSATTQMILLLIDYDVT